MKYYVIEISTGDEKIAGKGVYEYEDKNAAIASFHSKIGTAMKSSMYTTHLIMVVDQYGGVQASNYWGR